MTKTITFYEWDVRVSSNELKKTYVSISNKSFHLAGSYQQVITYGTDAELENN